MTYVYEGPSYLATIGIAVLAGAAFALAQHGLWVLQDWWDAYRQQPGAVDSAVDGVPIEHDDPPFPDGWKPDPADVELGRSLTRERFGGKP